MERMYGELAEWWPLISPHEEYAEEAAFAGALLETAAIPVREVLDLGSGGGHMAVHLADRFALTLVDRSEAMLTVSRRLNPGCAHVAGDMRTVRLGRAFDAVLVHDAICHMTSAADLRRAMETAFAHCRPGGVALLMPDETTESFVPGSERGGADAPDGRGARYLEWSWDPDPADTWIQTEYAFLLRSADGSVRSARDTHITGLFPRALWLGLLEEVGFRARAVTEVTSEDRPPRELFLGERPPERGRSPRGRRRNDVRGPSHHVVTMLRLFRDGVRTDPQPASSRERGFAFLDRVDQPFFARVRDEVERWYAEYPGGHEERKELRERYRKRAAAQHLGAWWELYLSHLFFEAGLGR